MEPEATAGENRLPMYECKWSCILTEKIFFLVEVNEVKAMDAVVQFKAQSVSTDPVGAAPKSDASSATRPVVQNSPVQIVSNSVSISSSAASSDAVRVAVGNTAVSQAKKDTTEKVASVEPKEPSKQDISIEEQAKKAAKVLENAINSVSNTTVKFEADKIANGDLRFKVVDRETGRVVRQFPPGEIISLADQVIATKDTSGILFDEAA